MTVQARISKSLTLGGKTFAESRSIECGAGIVREVSVAAAKTGNLTTRTDDDTGELTMAAAHGIITGDRLDLYWSGGRRLGMTVGTVAVNQVPIDGGTGDVLPADETAITAMVPQNLELRFDGDDAEVIAMYSAGAQGSFVFCSGAATAEYTVELELAAQQESWYADSGVTNPVAGDVITRVFVSHGDSTAARTMRVGVAYN